MIKIKSWENTVPILDFKDLLESLNINTKVMPLENFVSKEKAALEVLNDFIEHGLDYYNQNRNDPLKIPLSNLSPYSYNGMLVKRI